MAWKRVLLEMGMGTDIRGTDPTRAAVRALRDALWRNSFGLPRVLGHGPDAMRVEVTIGVPDPERVDRDAVLAVLPHGTGSVTVVAGGLRIPSDDGKDATLLAHAAAVVRMELPEAAS